MYGISDEGVRIQIGYKKEDGKEPD